MTRSIIAVLSIAAFSTCAESPVGSEPSLRLVLTPDSTIVVLHEDWTSDLFRVRLVRGNEEYDLTDSTLTWTVAPHGFVNLVQSDSGLRVEPLAYTDGITLRVSLGALADSAKIIVSAGPVAAVTGVSISPDPLVMAVGDTAQLLVAIARGSTKTNFTEPLDSLVSSAPGIVSVGADRRAVAHAQGLAVIRAYRGSRSDRDTIRVNAPPPPLTPALQVATSGVYSCALPANGGDVVCWPRQEDPLPIARGPGDMQVIAGTAGATHLITDVYAGCVILANTEGRCWGISYPVSLAVGDRTSYDLPFSPVLGGAGYRTIEVGGNNVCGIRTDSTAVCWGQSEYGYAGTGRAVDFITSPEPVLGGRKWTALTVGFGFACGIAADSTAYCWGYGSAGKLGNGADTLATAPVRVSGGHKAVQISAGDFSTCLLDAEGTAWCWGEGISGRLGDGPGTNSNVPRQVAGGHRFTRIKVGNGVSCGVTAAGEAWCWGTFADMRAGDDAFFTWPVPAQAPGSLAFASIAPALLAMCGVTGTGAVYCWGHNELGQLGDGTNVSRHRPSRVRAP